MLKIKEIKPKIGFIGSERQSILDDLNFAIKNKLDYYEIQGSGEKIDLELEIIEKAKKITKKNNISLSLHAFHLPISSLTPEISEPALKTAKEEIVLANKIGAKQITIHSGHKDKPENETAVAKNFEIFIKNFKELVKFGKKYRVRVGLENSTKNRAMCIEPRDFLNALNNIKGLKITLDVGHANTTDINPIDYFKQFKDFIINIHIHDNDGSSDQHALIGEGNIDFKNFLKECKNSNYYGPFILEVFPYKNVLKGREIFLKIWNQI